MPKTKVSGRNRTSHSKQLRETYVSGSWNHRVFKESYKNIRGGPGEIFFSIREVHYKGPSCGKKPCTCKPRAYTVEPIAPVGDSVESLRWVLQKMLEALDRPVLSKKNFK